MTSISKNELCFQIPLCDIWHLNGVLKFSPKNTYLKKIRNTWEVSTFNTFGSKGSFYPVQHFIVYGKRKTIGKRVKKFLHKEYFLLYISEVRKSWKKRWFVLDLNKKYLAYFETEKVGLSSLNNLFYLLTFELLREQSVACIYSSWQSLLGCVNMRHHK